MGSTTGGPPRAPSAPRRARSSGDSGRASAVARIAAVAALVLALVIVGVFIFGSGSPYTLRADFQNASGLVTGDNVLMGPATVGTVTSIGLTRNGQAEVGLSLDNVAPLHEGTVARIYQDSLSGIASKYVVLEPGPPQAPQIPSGGLIGPSHTFSAVNIDQLFNTFDARTRAGLQNLIRGEATSLKGRGAAANQALRYLAPGLQSAGQVTAELTRDEPVFDQLVVQGARAMQALASRSEQLSALITNTSTATGAIAGQSQALQQALSLLPSTLRRSTTTFSGLQSELNVLDPLVAASKPAVRRLPVFLRRLRPLIGEAIPTIGALNGLIRNPAGTGDLTSLARSTPPLARLANATFPELVRELNSSQNQLDYLRYYTPDVVGALTNLGQAGAYYDANGHYVRTQPALFPFALDPGNQLQTQFPSQRYDGLQAARTRCPGSAVQPSPDGSTPQQVPGCHKSSVPPGP